MMTLFLIGLGAIAALIGITVWEDMPPVDEFGCSLKGDGMETKKCNKCGKTKPLPEMTRRRDEETGEFK